MSLGQMRKNKSKLPPRDSYSESENKIMMIKKKVSDIAGTMRNSSKPNGSSSLSETWRKQENSDDSKLDALFHNNRLESYLQVFKENKISYKDLNLITKEDLIDMKIPIGPRNRIMKMIENPNFNQTSSECSISNRSEERRVGKECRSRWSPY